MIRLFCIVWLVCLCFYCAANSATTTDEMESFLYLGLPNNLPRAEVPAGMQQLLNDHSAKHLSNNAKSLNAALRLDGHVVLDVFSGWGVSYLPLSQSIGKSGIIVAIERDALRFSYLQNNAVNKEAWERTLLLHVDPCVVEDQSQLNLHTISSVMDSMGLNCPRLIRINDHDGLTEADPLNALRGGISLISRCRPYVLVDCRANDAVSATGIAEFFTLFGEDTYSLRGFDMEQVLTLQSADGDVATMKRVTPTLLAIPSDGQGDFDWLQNVTLLSRENIEGEKTTWERVIKYVNQTKFVPTVFHAQSELAEPAQAPVSSDAASESGPSCLLETDQQLEDKDSVVREFTQFTVYLSDVTHPESLLGVLLGLAPSDFGLATATTSSSSSGDNHEVRNIYLAGEAGETFRAALTSAGLDTLVVPYHFSSAVKVENLQQIAALHCAKWMHGLSAHLPDASHELPQQACTAFVEKRLRTLRRMLTVRTMTLQQSDLVLDRTGKFTNFPEARQYETLPTTDRPHMFYRMSEIKTDVGANHSEVRAVDPRATTKAWFTHQPFERVPDDAICGEPIWCSHTEEFQRRVHAWQNPQLPRTAVSDLSNNRHVRDWSRSPSQHSCVTSKYLVFEPISDKHGIGAMMELVAAAFRYAVCLDRILVLNFVNQEPTFLKWGHPGCQGSMFECYFQPVSGCILSTEEIAAAHYSTDGFEFHNFPLREERVLLLRGMPMEGPCVLCHSEWPTESRFFDGLYVGGTFNTSDKRHIKHAVAFRTHIKATWSSQFIRYLMRPRPWLQEAVSQVVLYSMRSPAPLSTNNLGSDQKYLDTSNFPQKFLSLHVRFGMKLAEAVLVPLTSYMNFISRKLPHLQDIFLSTETEAVIATLRA